MGNFAAISVCKNSKNILNTIEGFIYKVLQGSIMFKNYKLQINFQFQRAFILFLGFLSTKIISGSYFVLNEAISAKIPCTAIPFSVR